MDTTILSRAAIAARVRAEGTITLTEAALLLPRPRGRSKPLSWRTLERWCISGKAGVRLDGARIGGVWHTSRAAIERFRASAGM